MLTRQPHGTDLRTRAIHVGDPTGPQAHGAQHGSKDDQTVGNETHVKAHARHATYSHARDALASPR